MAEPRWMRYFKRVPRAVFDLIRDTLLAWRDDHASRLAAALAYYALFSIAPLLIILIAVIGLVFGERAVRAEIAYQIEDLVGRDAAILIQTMITRVSNPASGIAASLVGLVTILFGASGLFTQVQGALNTIWHVPSQTGRGVMHFLKQRLTHFAMVFVVGVLLLMGLFADVVMAAVTEYFDLQGGLLTRNSLVSLVMVTLLFAVIFRLLPDIKTAWRDVVVGAAVTALLFSVGKTLIGLYLGRSSVSSAYGAAGSLVALLLWIYYSAQIFLLGAEFTHVYAQKFGSLHYLVEETELAAGDVGEEIMAEVAETPLSIEAGQETFGDVDAPIVAPEGASLERTSPALFRWSLALVALLSTLGASLLVAWRWLRHHPRAADEDGVEVGQPEQDL